MKYAVGYWVIGCVITGLLYGIIMKECPDTKTPASDIVGVVAVWPVYLAASFTYKSDGKPPSCKLTESRP